MQMRNLTPQRQLLESRKAEIIALHREAGMGCVSLGEKLLVGRDAVRAALRDWGVYKRTAWTPERAFCEERRELICSLYAQGNGVKRIAKTLGWTNRRHQLVRAALERWGIYQEGRDKGGGWNRGLTSPNTLAVESAELIAAKLIVAEYKREQTAVETPERAWGCEWAKEMARRSSARSYLERRDSILAYQSERQKRLRATDPEFSKRRAAAQKQWVSDNLAHVREYRRGYMQDWMKENREKVREYRKRPATRIANNLRKRVKQIIRSSAEVMSELVGCTGAQLKARIEAQWKRGMTWANYGEWHIDHRIPCASFNLRDAQQRRQCFHFTNLRPLWAKDNIAKGARLERDEQLPMAISA